VLPEPHGLDLLHDWLLEKRCDPSGVEPGGRHEELGVKSNRANLRENWLPELSALHAALLSEICMRELEEPSPLKNACLCLITYYINI
jgi:hypothetical protein